MAIRRCVLLGDVAHLHGVFRRCSILRIQKDLLSTTKTIGLIVHAYLPHTPPSHRLTGECSSRRRIRGHDHRIGLLLSSRAPDTDHAPLFVQQILHSAVQLDLTLTQTGGELARNLTHPQGRDDRAASGEHLESKAEDAGTGGQLAVQHYAAVERPEERVYVSPRETRCLRII